MRPIISENINLLHLFPELPLPSKETHQSNQKQEAGLSVVNQAHERAVKSANVGETIYCYIKTVKNLRHTAYAN